MFLVVQKNIIEHDFNKYKNKKVFLKICNNKKLSMGTLSLCINAFSQNGVHSPEDLFHLEQNNLRLKDGAVVALTGGIEVPLQQHVEALKSSGSGRDYFFNGSGARGMSAAGSSNSASGGNSWG